MHENNKPVYDYFVNLEKTKEMRIIHIGLLILIFRQLSFADYMPLSLAEMVMRSECIVYGRISDTDEEFFVLEVENLFWGECDVSYFKVKKFVDFSCAARWTSYANDQYVFLFLKKDSLNNWVILSDGGEGEMPVKDGIVYLSSWYGFDMSFKILYRTDKEGNRFATYYQAFELYGGNYYGLDFELDEFSDAVVKLRNICVVNDLSATIDCDYNEAFLKQYASISELHAFLAEQTIAICRKL